MLFAGVIVIFLFVFLGFLFVCFCLHCLFLYRTFECEMKIKVWYIHSLKSCLYMMHRQNGWPCMEVCSTCFSSNMECNSPRGLLLESLSDLL
ncbi:mCG1038247 [Mus musculus]|nr:mCG1038247 [Mus musculus]